jgi:hypothetical protein
MIGSSSVFYAPAGAHEVVSVASERDAMDRICRINGMSLYYYEAAMALWSRIKGAYSCEIYVHGAERYLAVCLGVAVKWSGPREMTHHYCTLTNMRRHWDDLTASQWQLEEIRMLQTINWEL